MITINGIVAEYLGHTTPLLKVVSRKGPGFYKTLSWPVDKPLTLETIKAEVAKQWETDPDKVIILENVTIPKL